MVPLLQWYDSTHICNTEYRPTPRYLAINFGYARAGRKLKREREGGGGGGGGGGGAERQ
eukprot:COSAG05_NODE_626_length_8254_cov_12.820846_3_plen_59_part_00